MTSKQSSDILTVAIERDFGHPPEKVWRALTQPELISQWLMKTDFAPVAGHPFELRGEWGDVACRVVEIDPITTLAYTWDALGLESVVTWTLTPASAGTHLRMEQTGFRPDQQQAYQGAQYGWPQFFAKLDEVVASVA